MRPVSPFLTVYRPQFTSIFSILERVSGIILVFGVVVYLCSLKLSTVYMSSYLVYSWVFWLLKGNGIVIESLILFLLLSFFYHLYFGIRYIYWDKSGGRAKYFPMELDSVYQSSYILTGLTLVSVLIVWFVII